MHKAKFFIGLIVFSILSTLNAVVAKPIVMQCDLGNFYGQNRVHVFKFQKSLFRSPKVYFRKNGQWIPFCITQISKQEELEKNRFDKYLTIEQKIASNIRKLPDTTSMPQGWSNRYQRSIQSSFGENSVKCEYFDPTFAEDIKSPSILMLDFEILQSSNFVREYSRVNKCSLISGK